MVGWVSVKTVCNVRNVFLICIIVMQCDMLQQVHRRLEKRCRTLGKNGRYYSTW